MPDYSAETTVKHSAVCMALNYASAKKEAEPGALSFVLWQREEDNNDLWLVLEKKKKLKRQSTVNQLDEETQEGGTALSK